MIHFVAFPYEQWMSIARGIWEILLRWHLFIFNYTGNIQASTIEAFSFPGAPVVGTGSFRSYFSFIRICDARLIAQWSRMCGLRFKSGPCWREGPPFRHVDSEPEGLTVWPSASRGVLSLNRRRPPLYI